MAARIAPYLCYYASPRPLDDHGAIPAVLVVFDDDIAASHFVRVAGNEMRRTGVKSAPVGVPPGRPGRAGTTGRGLAEARILPARIRLLTPLYADQQRGI